MPIDFYYVWGSPPCHTIMFVGKTLGINFNMKAIDFDKGEHKSPEFRKINPQHTIPAIDDNGFRVSESRATIGYLVDQYAKDDALYPKDAKKRTVINQRLYFDIGTLYQGFLDYYCTVFETGKYGSPAKLEKLEDAFKILDVYLDGQEWAAGKDVSIADYSLAVSVASCECLGFDVSNYPNVSKWFSKSKKIPGYDETVGKGSAELKAYVDKCIK